MKDQWQVTGVPTTTSLLASSTVSRALANQFSVTNTKMLGPKDRMALSTEKRPPNVSLSFL